MYTLRTAYDATLGRLPSHVRAVVLILFSTMCFTSMHTVIRYASTEGNIHPFEVAFFRNVFGLMAVLPFALMNSAAALRTKRLKLHAVRGIMQVFAMLIYEVSHLMLEVFAMLGGILFFVVFLCSASVKAPD